MKYLWTKLSSVVIPYNLGPVNLWYIANFFSSDRIIVNVGAIYYEEKVKILKTSFSLFWSFDRVSSLALTSEDIPDLRAQYLAYQSSRCTNILFAHPAPVTLYSLAKSVASRALDATRKVMLTLRRKVALINRHEISWKYYQQYS